MKVEMVGGRIREVDMADGDLISRRALREEMAGIRSACVGAKAVRMWVETELLIEEAPAVTSVQDGAEKFVRCDECTDCCRSLVMETGHFCRNHSGMHGRLYPERGDGCSHGRRNTGGQDHGC